MEYWRCGEGRVNTDGTDLTDKLALKRELIY